MHPAAAGGRETHVPRVASAPPPLAGLSQRDACALALQAVDDFPGLEVFLQPLIKPRPLTDALRITGWVLIVAGPGGCSPWFEVRCEQAYDDLYARVYAYYDEDIASASRRAEEQEEHDRTELVPFAVVGGKSARTSR
jgi:hypothetical protein